MAEPGRLVVVATPIGNLDDLSPRAAAALRDADLVACEDTRRTATLLRHVGAETPMVASHEHNEAGRAADLVERMRNGATVALVSDAGMPAISDPGARAVVAAIEAGVEVTVIPGPSAVETALVASGLVGDAYTFVGFFPRKRAQRQELFVRSGEWPGATVGFESPHRVAGLLADLVETQPDRPVAIGRELTKRYEEVVRGSAQEVAARLGDLVRGEVTVVLGPVPAGPPRHDAGAVAAAMVAAGLGARAAADLAAILGVGARNEVYRAALALRTTER